MTARMLLTPLLLLALVAGLQAQDDGDAEPTVREHVHEDSQSCRIKTNLDHDDPTYLTVHEIKWDSAFRQTGLRVGDRIIKVNGEPISPPAERDDYILWHPRQVGQYHCYQAWVDAGKGEGTAVTLTVKRRNVPGDGWTEHEFAAELRCERAWNLVDANGRSLPTIGPRGPGRMKNDGFMGAWAGWEEKFQRHIWSVLDDGMFNRRFNSRMELKNHLDEKERIDYLLTNYPGPFANAMKADWEAALAVLQGNRYELGDDDLAYRQLGEKRAAEIKAAGETARTAWLEKHQDEMIEPFPGVDPITGDIQSVAGKLVVLPDIRRNWVSEAGDQTWAVCRGAGRDSCTYFVNGSGAAARRMYQAAWRYSKLVTPRIQMTYLKVVGRVLAEPRMVTTGNSAVTGLEVEPVAVTIDEKLFVDLSVTDDAGESPFAGEDLLRSPASALPADDASPRDVMTALVSAIKAGDEATFKALYADWRAVPLEDGRLLWYPWYRHRLDEAFVAARRLILDTVFDARVLWVGDVRRISTGEEFEGAPVIDQVVVELEHIGQFDDEYRGFVKTGVHRKWVLQRVNGGPWRIIDGQRF